MQQYKGDRMWKFGVGMFMVIIAPGSLRLTAVFGLSMGAANLLLGAHVGTMIDKMHRLSAARLTLVVQNVSVAACAVIIYFVITYKPVIRDLWPDEGLLTLSYGGIIAVAILSSLATTGHTIAVERDWVVEICGKQEDSLAVMTAAMKGIDLTTNIVAPIATGQIMAYAGVDIGAIFIAGWNVVSVFLEYFLLWKVYSLVPALRVDKKRRRSVKGAEGNTIPSPPAQPSTPDVTSNVTQTKYTCSSCLQGTLYGVTILVRGWKTFMTYDEAFAGLSLSVLYLTVFGFDNVTVGFAYTQGVNESTMGILMAASAAVGILGTGLYPRFVKCMGLVRTGLLGFLLQICICTLCVVSIWAPGSPFDPFVRSKGFEEIFNNGSVEETWANTTPESSNASKLFGDLRELRNGVTAMLSDGVTQVAQEIPAPVQISIILLLTGAVGMKCGLWITDLTVSQILLERVRETERGVVMGVQKSIDQFMEMLMFLLVIVIPEPEMFGILVLVSYGVRWLGWVLFTKYARTTREFHCNICITRLAPAKKYNVNPGFQT